MKYMLLIYRDEALFAAAPRSGPHSAAYVAYTESLKQAGAWISGDRLQVSDTASTGASMRARRKSSMAPIRKPRSNSAAITSSRRRISMPRWNGLRNAPPP